MNVSELYIFIMISGEEEVTYAPFMEVKISHIPLKYLVITKKNLVEEHQRLVLAEKTIKCQCFKM